MVCHRNNGSAGQRVVILRFAANRAFAELKRENYGSAIQDAEKSIQLDPTYIKAYYRRASAYLALERYKLARADFKKVLKLKPGDKDTTAKLDVCEKAITKKAFEEAIAVEATKPLWERANPDLLAVDSSYSGLHLPAIPTLGTAASQLECADDETKVNEHGMSLAFIKGMMETFRAQKSIHKKYAQQILQRLFNMARKMPSLVHATIPEDAKKFNICGDTHGQYYDTLNIFEINGLPSPTNPYLFNGDFVDRGSFSVENVFMLFAFKLLYPDYFHLTRGNHETKNMNKMYGFEGEVKAKFDQITMEMFSEVFCALPLSVVVNRKVIVIHGGLFQKEGVTLDDLAKIDRCVHSLP
jgi:serine/threonine-protein phosphatase 5